MLPYEEHIISDLFEDANGGVVVLAAGLPLHRLISALLHLHHPSQGSLILLSVPETLKPLLVSSNPNPRELAGDLLSHHRAALYSSGATLFATCRVLVADLLTSRAPPGSIAGLVILNAHRLSDTSAEAFAARLLRSHSPKAFVRAFTDRPDSMVAGFAKAERILKSLFVRKLHLWPRFHVQVSADLERYPPEVVDVRVPMTSMMKGIQAAVLAAMGACLGELRKTNKVDVEDLTMENGLFKSFDEIVRRQLDPIWHTIGKKTKQLVNDLKTLRKLLDYLVRYDAVTYLKYLDTLRVSEGVRSVWIFADSSHKIFDYAKKRVYQAVRADGVRISPKGKSVASKRKRVNDDKKEKQSDGSPNVEADGGQTSPNTAVVLEEMLEEAPKWKVLRGLLEEIEDERKREALSTESQVMVEDEGNNIVLIACKDERSCLQLEEFIVKGPHQVMREEWERYLLGKAELHGLRKRSKRRSQDPKGFGILNGTVANEASENLEPISISKMENDALLAAASEISSLSKMEITAGVHSEVKTRRASGRGRGKGRSRRPAVKFQAPNTRSKKLRENDRTEVATSGTEKQFAESNIKQVDSIQEKTITNTSVDQVPQKQEQNPAPEQFTHAKPLPPVQFYPIDSDRHILYALKPSVVIVYHPDMTFVREIEVYKSENPLKRLKVYFLFYEDSTEVQRFEASIRRENGAFESLIRQKSLMMIPVDQDGRCTGFTSSNEPQSLVASLNSLTRKAGGRKMLEKEMQVIVDMREFMSSLPNVLHQKGIRIIPLTLEVGDYILSPQVCVERKSIMDLFQSFASGRLYHQVETMVRYYRIPVLLIEFSQDKSFSFQSAGDLGDDVSPTSIISKLILLVMHFPRLRLVWSRSVHATAETFASLKANQDEPDESKAARVGIPSEDGVVDNDARAENYNTSAVEFLRRLPGVTDSNYRALMDGCDNLAELALLPVERLAELMGGQKAARTLKEFLDAKFPTML